MSTNNIMSNVSSSNQIDFAYISWIFLFSLKQKLSGNGARKIKLVPFRYFTRFTLKQILSQICTGDWFMSLDLKDACHIQVAPYHRRFLRFAFDGVAYQYKVLPFGLSLAPALLHDSWMRLSPLCDRWESAYSITSVTGSFWPSRRRF